MIIYEVEHKNKPGGEYFCNRHVVIAKDVHEVLKALGLKDGDNVIMGTLGEAYTKVTYRKTPRIVCTEKLTNRTRCVLS
jgi:hypothetical protein